MIVIDVETTGLEWSSDITGGVMVADDFAVSMPCDILLQVYSQTIGKGLVMVSHTNFDVHVIRHHTGCTPSERLDTQVMAKCYDPSLFSYKLDTLCQKWLGISKDTKPETWTEWDEKTATYCLQDGLITQQLAKFLLRQDLGNYWNVEQPFHKVVDEMEWKGIEVDQEYILSVLSELEVEYNTKLQELHSLVGIVPTCITTSTLEPKEKTYSKGVYKRLGVLYGTHVEVGALNPASNNQVLWVLRHRYGVDLDTLDKTETGLYSTSNLPKDLPITPLLSELSRITKLTDYLKNVVNRVTSNSTVHSSFQQIGAVTGRMSSSSPNLQNPANDERVRKSFSVKDGSTQVGWDLSNIEGRLLAEAIYRETGDKTMLDIFLSGKDFHLTNAHNWGLVELFGDEKLARQRAKAFFGLAYGGGVKAIAEYAKAPLEIGQVIYDSLEKNFPSFFIARDSIVKRAEENGGVIYSMFGRKLFYPEYVPSLLTKKARAVMGPEDSLHQVRKQLLTRANRQVFNAYIQGSAADIIKIINNKLYQYGYCPNAIIHDEDQIQLPTEQVEDYMSVVSRVFDEFNRESKLEVPITYEIKTGRNWAETH